MNIKAFLAAHDPSTQDPRLPASGGVYVVVNLWTMTPYVGQSSNVLLRVFAHKAHLRTGTHTNCKLQASWDEYGEPAFAMLLYRAEDDPAKRVALEREAIRDLMPNCFNHSVNGQPIVRPAESRAARLVTLPRRVPKSNRATA
jgi:hypothetical protein